MPSGSKDVGNMCHADMTQSCHKPLLNIGTHGWKAPSLSSWWYVGAVLFGWIALVEEWFIYLFLYRSILKSRLCAVQPIHSLHTQQVFTTASLSHTNDTDAIKQPMQFAPQQYQPSYSPQPSTALTPQPSLEQDSFQTGTLLCTFLPPHLCNSWLR